MADSLLAARPASVRGPRGNLPIRASRFVGREVELAQVHDLVAASRLVTLTGMGGAGKTRLGLQVAAGLAGASGDGPWFADLAPVSDPDLVPVSVANVLGIRPEPGRPVLETLVEAVGGRSLLVLLDNCEHVVGACAKLADSLLRGCPELRLLATSREPLGVDGEQVYRVPPMSVPADGDDQAAIQASEAVRLFEDRAAAHGVALGWDGPEAAVAARICRRLDGIPLAIELAAARLRMMPAAELEARLDQRFAILTSGSRAALPRQQTLRATVDWSWELLTGAEQAALAALSVFAGGFGLAAAEAVAAGLELPTEEVIGHLAALVDKSLVQFDDIGAGPGRYRLLETVRQYAASRLDALVPAAAQAARIRHRDYYLALAQTAAPQLIGPDQAAWLDRLDAELANVRAAIAFSSIQPDAGPGMQIVASLGQFWRARGHSSEGAEMLRALLAAPSVKEPTLVRARALAAAANLFQQTGSYAIAEDCCQEGLAIARAAEDNYLVGELLYVRAWIHLRQGQREAAQPLIESGLTLTRSLGVPYIRGCLLATRAHAAYAAGDEAGAARDAAEALPLFRQAGDKQHVATMLGNLGNYEMSAGNTDAARRYLTEALDILRALNHRDGIAYQTLNLGLAEYLSGSPGTARALFAESLELTRHMGMKALLPYVLLGLAMVNQDGAGPGQSARLHGVADRALDDVGRALEPLEGRLANRHRQRLRALMGTEEYEAEYAAGRALDLAQVLAVFDQADTTAGQALAAGEPGVLTPAPAMTILTSRELDVLKLVAQGLSNSAIARRLVLSDHTVHRHLANIRHKLGLSSRAAAAAWGVRAGLV